MPLRRGLLRRVTTTISLIVVQIQRLLALYSDGLETELESWLFVKVEIHSVTCNYDPRGNVIRQKPF